MTERNSKKHSEIITGSFMNKSYNAALQDSTILAGQLANQSFIQNNLLHPSFSEETLDLDISSTSMDNNSNILNINIDAISSDDEVFYDCLINSNSTSQDSLLNNLEDYQTKRKEYQDKAPTSTIFKFPSHYGSTISFVDSGINEQCTGALLANDFMQLNSHPHSSPNEEIVANVCQCSHKHKTLITKLPSPSLVNATFKVANLKKFFETAAGPRLMDKKPSKLPLAVSRTFNASIFTNQSNSYRSSSCSDYVVKPSSSVRKGSFDRSPSKRRRSRSANDVGTLSKSKIKKSPLRGNFVTQRKKQFQRDNGIKIIAKRSVSPRKVSTIMERKSIGFISSPIKPVSELRKKFIPRKESQKIPVIKLEH